MQIQHHVNLQPLHTFGLDVYTEAYTELHQLEDLHFLQKLKNQYQNLLILGGGSNVLFLENYKGIVVHNKLNGIEIIDENDQTITLKVASGVCWHEFVLHTVENNWGGIENLSLIPGTVGAAPMQNIGAYGVEVKDVIQEVFAYDIEQQKNLVFTNQECQFAYRNSIFKYPENKEKYFITHVSFRLKKNPDTFQISYGDIQKTLSEMNVDDINIKNISDAVIHIRSLKLPNPNELGNAGSFFKNPEIKEELAKKLISQYPEMPYFKLDNQLYKIPAAWLIEQCGWKGLKIGQTGNHTKQALVIVNYGKASGEEIRQHAENVQKSVEEKFNITLHPEVNYIKS